MRALDLGRDAFEAISAVRQACEHPNAWYVPGESDFVPGDLDRHVISLNGIRCVFSITIGNGLMVTLPMRHMSFSIPGGKKPSPIHIFTIAKIFGFVGGEELPSDSDIVISPGPDWQIGIAPDGSVVVAQPIPRDKLSELSGDG
jgi:hypothetical protein